MKKFLALSTAAAALALLPVFAANAQTRNPKPGTPTTGPGAIPTGAGAIPMPGVGQILPAGSNPVSPPASAPGGANPTVLYPYGYNYPYGNGGGNTVIINNYPGVYDNGYYNNGYNYYQPSVRVSGTGGISTSSVTLFGGYYSVYLSGRTVLSPFGAFYGTPAYISTRYILTAPYPYLTGREIGVLPGLTVLRANETAYAPVGPQTGTQTPSVASSDPASDVVAGMSARKTALLRDALSDVQAFWVQGNTQALRRRLLPMQTVAVFQNEQFAYSLKRTDFLAISTDALTRTQTTALDFRRVAVRSDGLVNAYAAHTYTYRLRGGTSNTRSGGGVGSDRRTATVRVSFVWDGGDWFVSAVSFAPGSLGSPGR